MNNDYKNILKNYTNPSILLLPLLEENTDKWNYEKLCVRSDIPIEFWDRNPDKVNWSNICRYSTLSFEFLEKYFKYLDFDELTINDSVPIEFLETHFFDDSNYFNLSNFWRKPISLDFIEKNHHKFTEDNWYVLGSCPTITEEFWEKFKDKFNARSLCINPNFSANFWRKHKDIFNLEIYCWNSKIDIKLLEEYENKLDENCWEFLSSSGSYLPEEFLIKNVDILDWIQLSNNSKIPYSFWIKNMDKIVWTHFYDVNIFTEEDLLNNKNSVCWYSLSHSFNFSRCFIEEYSYLLNGYNLVYNPHLSLTLWKELEKDYEIIIENCNTSLKEVKNIYLN